MTGKFTNSRFTRREIRVNFNSGLVKIPSQGYAVDAGCQAVILMVRLVWGTVTDNSCDNNNNTVKGGIEECLVHGEFKRQYKEEIMINTGKKRKKPLLTMLVKKGDASGNMVQKDATQGQEILLF